MARKEKKIELARSQRQAEIPAERILWKVLRNRAFLGIKFRRQHPIRRYVVDFACAEIKLVIELDGVSHLETRKADSERSREIEGDGWLIIRFWNTDIYDDLDAVKEAIFQTCTKLSGNKHPSPPAPLPSPTT
jgi:very-short-patch-repair endonuclease